MCVCVCVSTQSFYYFQMSLFICVIGLLKLDSFPSRTDERNRLVCNKARTPAGKSTRCHGDGLCPATNAAMNSGVFFFFKSPAAGPGRPRLRGWEKFRAERS